MNTIALIPAFGFLLVGAFAMLIATTPSMAERANITAANRPVVMTIATIGALIGVVLLFLVFAEII